MEMVHLQHVWEKYNKNDVVILGFNSADDKAIAEEFLQEKGITFPNILDPSWTAKEVSMTDYKGSAVPLNYVIGRDGRVVAGFSGYAKGDRRGLDALEDALVAPAVQEAREAPTAAAGPGMVTGSILGPDGEPLAHALVRLQPTTRWFGRGNRIVSTRADGLGRYELRNVPEGAWDVQVQVIRPRSYVAPAGRLILRAGKGLQHEIRIAARTLKGRVTRHDTKGPLRTREVQITARPVEGGASVMAFADDDGRFVFVGLPSGEYVIRVFPFIPELREITRTVDFTGKAKLAGVDFSLKTQRVGTLRVRVRGAPAGKLGFWLVTGRGSVRTLHGDEVEPGVWEFVVPAGERVVEIAIDGTTVGLVEGQVGENKTLERTVNLGRGD
ncbi:MAG: hypothetical protein ACYSUM_22900 [Planctomycetota bacterium]